MSRADPAIPTLAAPGGANVGSMDWRERDGVRWLDAALPGATAAFSTRVGGVSAGDFASLNLGLLTDDEADAV